MEIGGWALKMQDWKKAGVEKAGAITDGKP